MTKILVVGGDMDVIRILQDNLHGHEIVALTEREARNHIVLVDEHACPIGQYLAALNKPLSLTEINSILIHECLEMKPMNASLSRTCSNQIQQHATTISLHSLTVKTIVTGVVANKKT